MTKLEEENPEKLNLYVKQKCRYLAVIQILLEEVDKVLQRDDERQQEENKSPIRTPAYYPSKEELQVEAPQETI